MAIDTYRVVIVRQDTQERKAYIVKALTNTEAIRRVARQYRGICPITLISCVSIIRGGAS